MGEAGISEKDMKNPAFAALKEVAKFENGQFMELASALQSLDNTQLEELKAGFEGDQTRNGSIHELAKFVGKEGDAAFISKLQSLSPEQLAELTKKAAV